MSWTGIQAGFGAGGVTELISPGRFTDDTQMTLFTVEGLIRASVRSRSKGSAMRRTSSATWPRSPRAA